MNANELELTVPLSTEAPRQVRHALERYASLIEPSLLDDVRLCCSELVANAVQHSARPDGDPITVSLRLGSGMIRVEVGDRGERIGTFDSPARSSRPRVCSSSSF